MVYVDMGYIYHLCNGPSVSYNKHNVIAFHRVIKLCIQSHVVGSEKLQR